MHVSAIAFACIMWECVVLLLSTLQYQPVDSIFASALLSHHDDRPSNHSMHDDYLRVLTSTNIVDYERQALQELFSSTLGTHWTWKSDDDDHWNFTDHDCNPCSPSHLWEGLQCIILDEDFHVVSMNLSSYNLSGTIPRSIGWLSRLDSLDLSANYFLHGTIPDSVGNLSSLRVLDLGYSQLTGSLPLSIYDLSSLTRLEVFNNSLEGPVLNGLSSSSWISLQYLSLGYNEFTSSLPTEISSLVSLEHLSIDHNYLSGPIPSDIGRLTNLTYLSVIYNALTHSIPPSINHLVLLADLGLSFNQLTGTIPDLSRLTRLSFLDLGFNMLNGTVSSSIASLKLLTLLGLSFNMLTGTIPPFMNELTGLIYYYFDSNMLTGTVTQSFESLSQIRYLYLSDNTFTGSFPSSGLQYLTNLTDFEVNGNLFIGTLPNTIALLPLLQIIFFQDNLFTGPITNIFNGSTQLFLSNIQLSNNQLTGNLPEQLFRHLPSLEAFSAVSNCFHGRIPSSICQSTSLISLALDGLTCASSCQKKIFPSTISSSYQSSFSIDHGIPLCLFQMPLLQTLHLSGNGLTGSFPSDLEISPSLEDLSLSHNSLTGSIPDSIQKRYWSELDLSFNRIDGVILHNFNKADHNAKLRLENNRLSGPIPNSSIRNMTNFSILQGNLFSCRIDRSDLPRSDPYANSYECASNSFDIVYFIWLANITIAIVLVGIVLMSMYYYSYCRRRGLIVRDRSIQLVTMLVDLIINWKYVRLIISDTHSGWKKLNKLMTINSIMRRFTANVTLFIVIVLLPIYTVLNYYYHTHEYEYTWTVSCGYIAGRVAFVVLIVTFVLFLMLQISMLMFYLHEHRDVFADNIDSDDLVQILIDSNSSRISMIPSSITDHTMRRQEVLSSAMKLKDDAVTADASTNWTHKISTGNNGDGDSEPGNDDRNDDSDSQASQYSSITRQSQRDDKDNLFATRQSFPVLRDLFALPKVKRATNWMIYFVYISSNLIIVSGVNVAYVYATLYHSNNIIVIAQILLSLFKLLWNTIISPGMVMYLVYFVSDDDYNRLITMRGMFQLQFVLSLCNNIVIPFLVVLVISPNCFYSAFGKVNTVDSSFHYNYCLFINPVNDICTAYTLKKATTSYDAPFVYNYQCSSSIIESYAAVFMYMCIVTTFIHPLMRVILYHLHQKWLSITAVVDSNSRASGNTRLHSAIASADSKDNSNDYSTDRSTTSTTHPQWMIMRRSAIDLFFYLTIPKLQLPLTATGDPKREPLDPFISINHVFVMDMTFLAILLSFGTVFPPLAAAVCIAVITRNYIRELIITSFHDTAMKLHKPAFVTILESECASIPPLVIFKSCGWWVMMVSCCFYSLFLFDMLGDEMGALESYWVLIVMPLLPCVLYVSMKAYKYFRDHFVMVVHRDDNGAEDEEMKRYNNHPSLPHPPSSSSSCSNNSIDLHSNLDKNIELMEPQVYNPFQHAV